MFLADDGHLLIKNRPSRFSSMFDWIVTENDVLKKKAVPETIFVKTDYLPRFVCNDFPSLSMPFILITGSSDWSPSVNFPREYEILVESCLVTKWYMLNCLSVHEKVFSYPGGLCHNEVSDEILLSTRREAVKREDDKILCIWRNRDFNVCGDKYITRHRVETFVKEHTDIFDWVDATLTTTEFYQLLSRYKFVLCPVGNGVDPCPKAFEALIVKTIPIMIRTRNTEEVYADLPSILLDSFEALRNMKNLDDIYESYKERLSDDSLLEKFSCEYWYNTIMRR